MLPASLVALTLALASQQPAEFKFEIRNDIVYSKVGDRELLLDAYLPEKGGPSPAVLVVHGGAWRMGNRKQLRGYAEALAKTGFVCFAIDYRLAPEHKFPAQIEDCRSAVKWMRANAAHYKVDPKKLGAIGYSAGGHLVSLLGTTGEAPTKENGNVDTRLQVVVAGGASFAHSTGSVRRRLCRLCRGKRFLRAFRMRRRFRREVGFWHRRRDGVRPLRRLQARRRGITGGRKPPRRRSQTHRRF